MQTPSHSTRGNAYLQDCRELLAIAEPMLVSGRVTRVAGLVMEAVGLKLPVGSACTVPLPNGAQLEAEVVGFAGDHLYLMPQSDIEGIVPGARVFPVEVIPTLPGLGQVAGARRVAQVAGDLGLEGARGQEREDEARERQQDHQGEHESRRDPAAPAPASLRDSKAQRAHREQRATK